MTSKILKITLLVTLLLSSCQTYHEWDLDTKGGTDIRRFFGRWTLDGITEVNLAPMEGVVNGIEVQQWPTRARLGVLVWNEQYREVEASGIDFVYGLYYVPSFRTWNNDGELGGEIVLESDSNTYTFTR